MKSFKKSKILKLKNKKSIADPQTNWLKTDLKTILWTILDQEISKILGYLIKNI